MPGWKSSPSSSGSAPTSSSPETLCTNEHGELVMEAFTTVMGHEGDNSINLKWDKETGQVVRTA